MEFRLANGTVITDEDIECECAEYESGSWAGTLTNLHAGSPRLSEAAGLGFAAIVFLKEETEHEND